MLLRVSIEGLDQVRGDYDAIARRAADLGAPLHRLGLHHQRKGQRILRSGERGIQSRNPASGLEGSITFGQPAANELEVGSNKVYAASQQFGPPGGVYQPVTAKYLTIPIADNLGARGNPKYDSPREVPDGSFRRSKSGNLLFFRWRKKKRKSAKRKGRGPRRRPRPEAALGLPPMSAIELLFVLKKQVIGHAYKYVTHDPDDQGVWDRLVGGWILRGRK